MKRNELLTEEEREEIQRRENMYDGVQHKRVYHRRNSTGKVQNKLENTRGKGCPFWPTDQTTTANNVDEEQESIKARLLVVKEGLKSGQPPTIPNLKTFSRKKLPEETE